MYVFDKILICFIFKMLHIKQNHFFSIIQMYIMGMCVCVCVVKFMSLCNIFIVQHGIQVFFLKMVVLVFWFFFLFPRVVKKVAQYMADVLEDSKDKVQENLLANGGKLMFYDSIIINLCKMNELQKQKGCKNSLQIRMLNKTESH